MSGNPDHYAKNNVERFSGFEACYDENRPGAPQEAVWIITAYLGKRPSCVVDLGCGTGLSTFVWKDHADRIIGVEPNDGMRGKAEEKRSRFHGVHHISFVRGYSDQLPFASGTVDVITCSQSFHWMEPASTLKEVSRVLRDGGIFAAYDCDWPPTVHWRIEDEYNRLINKADSITEKLADKENLARKWNKEEHLGRMRASGVFRFVKEIVFHKMEKFDAKRLTGLMLSQGGVQTVYKLGSDELNADIEAFRRLADQYFEDRTIDVMLSYRMRIGVK